MGIFQTQTLILTLTTFQVLSLTLTKTLNLAMCDTFSNKCIPDKIVKIPISVISYDLGEYLPM